MELGQWECSCAKASSWVSVSTVFPFFRFFVDFVAMLAPYTTGLRGHWCQSFGLNSAPTFSLKSASI